jgi:hypothetical protein
VFCGVSCANYHKQRIHQVPLPETEGLAIMAAPEAFKLQDIFYTTDQECFPDRPPVRTEVLKAADVRSVDKLQHEGVRQGNLNLLLSCNKLPEETKHYIFRLRKNWPQLRLFVHVI